MLEFFGALALGLMLLGLALVLAGLLGRSFTVGHMVKEIRELQDLEKHDYMVEYEGVLDPDTPNPRRAHLLSSPRKYKK